MNKVKYFVDYFGPSYSPWGTPDAKDAEPSLYSAMVSFRRRNVMGYDDVNTYAENADGEYVPWEMNRRVEFPATTDEDYMDVYYAVRDDSNGTYILGDWAYRLTIGPRKGVRVEKC